MNQPQCEALVANLIDCLQQGDVTGFCCAFTQDAELILPDAYCIGQDAICNAVTLMHENYTRIEITLRRVVQQDNLAFVEWHWQDLNKITGEPSQADTMIVLEFQGDKIQRWREYRSRSMG